MEKEEIIKRLWDFYKSNGNFCKSDLRVMGLPSYNTLMRMGISFLELKDSFARQIYADDPKLCRECGKTIGYDSRLNTFCTRSCSASSSNRSPTPRKRGPPKGSPPKFKVWEYNKTVKVLYTKVSICTVCGKIFPIKTNRKTCSKDCHDSIVKKNRGRHKRSYMELAFSEWLELHCVQHQIEVQFKDIDKKKCYYVDFLFEDKRLVIELDGSQHKHTKEKDSIRDAFIQSLGYTVLRVTHKEFVEKSQEPKIRELLNINNNKGKNMTTSKERKAQIVDPLDAEAALSEMQSILRHRGMSTTDLAIELGWTRNKTEDFFFGVDFPSLKEFQAVSKVLQYTLEF